jgi:uncharacterized membrane protein
MTKQPDSAPSTNPVNLLPETLGFHASVIARLRAYFLAGVLITAPIGITIYLAWQFIRYVDTTLTPLLPDRYNPATYLPFSIPGLGVIMAIVGLTLIGFFTAGFVGRFLIRVSEGVLSRMPVVRGLYGAIKQIFETVFKSQSNAFQQVVLVEFPCPEAWSLGFISGDTVGEVRGLLSDDMVNVFVPMTPNITSGYLIFLPRRKLVPLSMTVEEGLKMVVSIGIVTPPDNRLARAMELARSQQAAQ